MTRRRDIPDLPKKFGAVYALVVALGVAVLNTWAALDEVASNTISAWVTHGGRLLAVIPWGLGVVAGHWCSRYQGLPDVPGGLLVLGVVTAVLVAVDVRIDGALARYPFWVWLLLGIPMGAVLWPMREVAA